MDLVFIVQKLPFRDAVVVFKNWLAEIHIFIVFFLGARVLGQVVKQGIFGQKETNRKC